MVTTTFAARSAHAVESASPVLAARRAASALSGVVRLCFHGQPAPRLDDRLLRDIGLTRADYEALRG